MGRGRKAQWPPPVYTIKGRAYLRVFEHGKPRNIPLGAAGSPEAKTEYLRQVAILEANDRKPTLLAGLDLTVAELVQEYLRQSAADEARTRGRKQVALQALVDLFGDDFAAQFGPVAFQVLQKHFTTRDISRRYIYQLSAEVRKLFRWAAANELLPYTVAEALWYVGRLAKGQGVSGKKVFPADLDAVEATLPYLHPTIAAIVRLQLVTGMRPGEALVLKPEDIDREWKDIDGVRVWLYRLDQHKTGWRGHLRWIPLGPRAQEILRPFLDRSGETYCFSPREVRRAWEIAKRAARKTRVQPSQRDRRKANPKRSPGVCYSTNSYSRVITKGIARAEAAARKKWLQEHPGKEVPEGKVFVPHWAPNQLRHTVGTRVETDYSREDARCYLGHKHASTTAIYAEQVERAARLAVDIG